MAVGTWGIGNFKLPDFGITEKYAKPGQTNYLGMSLYNPAAAKTSPQVLGTQTNSVSNPIQGPAYYGPQNNLNNVTGGGGGGVPNTGFFDKASDEARRSAEQTGQMGGDVIDRDFESAMMGLNQQQGEAERGKSAALQQVDADYAPARTAIGEEQATRESGLAKEASTATTQEKTALQQARDLFRQIQQENIAQTSGLGISSSSVSEGLAERLGVETARRIASVTSSTQEILQNIKAETTRVQTFYKQKLSDLEQSLAAAKTGIQNQFVNMLEKINTARQVAANDKANRRAELLDNVRREISAIDQNALQYKQQLSDWATKKSASLADAQKFVISPTDFAGQARAIQGIAGLPQVGNFQAVPNIESTQQGLYITPKYEQKPDDELQNPFAV